VVKRKHIFLIGFSGSGKSTLGPLLARRLKTEFYDTDTMIERQCGKTIDKIFSNDGEAAFRRLESQVITRLIRRNKSRIVIALGGGAFQRSINRSIVKQHGVVVYLSCSMREIYRRLREKTDRPLLRVSPVKGETQRQAILKRIKCLLNQRRPGYAQADIRISTTDKSVSETVKQLYRKVRS